MKTVMLIGHGGVPRDYPRERLARLRRLEQERQARGGPLGPEEAALDLEIRSWPRTDLSDPYRAGLEALAARLRPLLGGARLVTAYNEFCAPSIPRATADAVAAGSSLIVLVSSMMTPGGSHAEIEIPEEVERLRTQYLGVRIVYAWPFDLGAVARVMAEQVAEAAR